MTKPFTSIVFSLILPTLVAATPTTRPAPRLAVKPTPPPFMLGVNLCGGEFGDSHLPGEFNRHYTYPTAKNLDYYKSKNILLIRLPFRWERLQHELNAPLDPTELKRLDEVVKAVRERGMKVIPEPHNYARYRNNLIGSEQVPNAAFANFWNQLAAHYKDEQSIYAFGLVNEPHDTKGLWPGAAQAAVDAIRAADPSHYIIVPGDNWSGAADWKKSNPNLWINDPSNRILYEAHLYFDNDKSGNYKKSYDEEKATPNIGIDRLKEFESWLDEHNAVGIVGEFGVPANNPRWLEAMDNFVKHLHKIKMPATYWAAGPWWNDYLLSIEPKNGQDKPQLKILTQTTPKQ